MSTPKAPLGFGTAFDAHLAATTPCIFTCDADGELRLSLERSREAWDRLAEAGGAPPVYADTHALLRDRGTGWVMYVRAGAPALLSPHPRADVAIYADQHAALSALASLSRPPVLKPGDPRWPPGAPTSTAEAAPPAAAPPAAPAPTTRPEPSVP
jgi:hypothetical protein